MPQIRGAFPLPISNLFEGMGRIRLASGGVFYFPSGNYIVTSDTNSVIEVWDPVETVWRLWITANNSESVYCDGYNFRARNITGAIGGGGVGTPPAITPGSGMTNGIGPVPTGVSLGFTPAGAGFQTPAAYAIVGGSVAAPTVTQAGSGFAVVPLIVIDPPPVGGIQAAAHATLTAGGGINTIVVDDPGAGYVATPNFWIIPQSPYYQGGPPGGPTSGLVAAPIVPGGLVHPANALASNQNTGATGALLTPVALIGSGTLTGIGIINNGGGYATAGPPTVTVTGGAGGAAVAVTVALAPAIAVIRSQPRVQ